MTGANLVARIGDGLAPHGLVLRGGFRPVAADLVPALADGRAAATLLLVGNVGDAAGDPMWAAFAAARHRFPGDDPLNDWTRAAIDPLARDLDAQALYPFGGPPFHPFQRWAMRAEPVAPSPLGLLIHPRYGLWHAYRAALVFAEAVEPPPRAQAPSPCDACADKPCLAACPVGAFTVEGYDVPRCAAFLETDAGEDCMTRACRARRACPVAPGRAQAPDQARFHMAAFRRGARRGAGSA